MKSYLKLRWLIRHNVPFRRKNEIESLEHLFCNCEITRSFCVALRSWLMECNINLEPLSFFNALFGIFNAGEDFVTVNHLILVEKCYIYRCKLNGVKPAMRVLKTKIGPILNIESRIAFMRNKVEFHDKKWEKKSNVVSIKSILPAPPVFSICLIFLFVYFCCQVCIV